MRILHIVPSYKPAYIYGGPIMSVSKMCEALSATSAVDIQVITTNANGKENLSVPLGTETDVDGVKVIYFARVSGDPHHASPALWRYLLSHARNYDVVHVHSWWNLLCIVATAICIMKRRKIILSPRGMFSDYIFKTGSHRQKKYLHKTAGRYLLSKTLFHATSDQEYKECKALIKGWRGFNIPNLVALPPVNINKKEKEIFTLGFLSRIDPKKGIEFLIKAIETLPFPVSLRIAGEGDEEYVRQLRQMAIQLQVDDKIEWVGWKGPREKFEELAAFDLFVLPSFNENFANVVIEALHAGTPVCISRYVGLAPFVEEKGLGWITDLSVDALAKNIINARYDASKRRQIEATAAGIINAYFSEPVVTGQYVNMYRMAVSDEFPDKRKEAINI